MMDGVDDFVRGEALDVVFDILDEQTLDEWFEDDFDQATADMGVQQSGFSCKICSKQYKTKNGLQRHVKKKHSSTDSRHEGSLQPCDIMELVQKSQAELLENSCYPQALRERIAEHDFQLTSGLQNELVKAYDILEKHGDAEKFYSFFYGKIVVNAEKLMIGLPVPMSTLLAKHLGDKILYFFKRLKLLSSSKPQPINEKEMDGLQYLCGYVVHKLLKKTWRSSNCKSETSQSVICLLNNLIENDNRSQRLIKTTTRGGLTAVKVEIQQIFILAEEAFRKTLVKSSHTAKLDVQLIIDQLMMDTQVISMYNSLVDDDENYSIKSEVKFSVLENMLKLYLRVRAFSFAKDIVNNHKFAMKKSKARALRKDIKKATDKPDVTE